MAFSPSKLKLVGWEQKRGVWERAGIQEGGGGSEGPTNLVRPQTTEDEKTLEGQQARLPFTWKVFMVR